ncbi:MAG: hypothetical protein QOF76_2473 [Solirubrobacteraceae bacterium]|jgi:sugar O-acyltransferase (sialic acid O-acetyltransferase NeuD family)|nr:hypothetical protein [Solirubrobacteraceae bacterium]
MRPIARIEAPLVNPNEPEAQVTALDLEAYGPIARGQVIATLETSKATVDVVSEHDGFVGPVALVLGGRVVAGELICEVFSERPDPAAEPEAAPAGDRKVTRKAAALAEALGVDLAGLSGTGFVTEAEVQAAAAESDSGSDPVPNFSERSLVLFGGGGLARVIIDLVRERGEFEVAGVVDDGAPAGLGVPVLGGGAVLGALAEAGLQYAVNAVGAIGRMSVRRDVSARLAAAGLEAPVLIDPSASVAATAILSPGALVFAQAVVSSGAAVGAHTIVNSGAIVSHDCVIGADAHIAPGAVLAGEVVVGDGALVGMAVTVPVGVSIGAGAVVGNGATVLADVPAGAVVPAGSTFA